MATKTRQQLSDTISDLCDQAGCRDKIRELHKAQFVDRRWNPHPPRAFLSWWNMDGRKLAKSSSGRDWEFIDAVRAFNCADVRQAYGK